MPWGEIDSEDPNELVGVECDSGAGAADEMARSIVEEYVRMGMGEAEIVRLFESPFFGLTHEIWRVRGAPYVEDLVRTTLDAWRGTGGP